MVKIPAAPTPVSRREFMRLTGMSAAACAMTGVLPCPQLFAQEMTTRKLPNAVLDSCGRSLPRLGFGGYPICTISSTEDAVAVVRHAMTLGVRYFDTAPSYGQGRSEERIGRAMAECQIPREEFYVATKTLARDAAGARRELEDSLKRLGTDYVDAVQVHAVHSDFESLFKADSVLDALKQAREEQIVKSIAITGHANPEYLVECVRRFPFSTALVPINPIDTKHLSFVRDFLPAAKEHNVDVIGMKVFGGGSLLKIDGLSVRDLLRYALSQPGVDLVVPGCDKIAHVDEAYEAIVEWSGPMSADELASIEEKVGPHRGADSEWYKERR